MFWLPDCWGSADLPPEEAWGKQKSEIRGNPACALARPGRNSRVSLSLRSLRINTLQIAGFLRQLRAAFRRVLPAAVPVIRHCNGQHDIQNKKGEDLYQPLEPYPHAGPAVHQ